MSAVKRCAVCAEELPLDTFCRNGKAKDGRASQCRACHRAYNRKWREENPERVRETRRRYAAANREKARKGEEKWKRNNHAKRLAHRAVYRAIRSGSLVRPDVCSGCGQSGEVQAHHDDYNKQLEVRWLCRRCHHRFHADEKLGVPNG